MVLLVLLAACNPFGNRTPVVQSLEASPNNGTAPLPAQIRWQVSDPNLTCRLDVDGDGAFDYTQPCGQNSLEHTYTQAGSYAVRLEASDGTNQAMRVTGITVAAPSISSNPNNRPPLIQSLSADPASGYAPFSTRLSWNISDPDGDALICHLDLGNNQSQLINPCGSSSSLETTFGAGRHRITLNVEDTRGLTASQTLDLEASLNPGGPDLWIAKTEWGQSILKPDLKLVSDKPALLRVYVLADRPNVSASLQAQVYRNNAFLGNISLSSPNSIPTEINPADLSQSFSGVVPAEWVQSGLEVRLQADSSNTISEVNESNNRQTLRPALMTSGNTLYLTIVPIVAQGSGTASIPNFRETLLDLLPIRDAAVYQRPAYTFGQAISNDGAVWSKLLSEIATLRVTDGSPRYYYGFVNVPYASGIAGLGYLGWPAAVGWTRSSAPQIMAHELGHNFGRSHAPCAVSDPDPGFPYAGASLGSWGYSLYGLRPAGQPLVNPASFRDVMSYCNPQWVSDYTYGAIQRFLEANPPQAQGTPGVSLATTQPVLLVRGSIRGALVSLEPLQRLQAPLNLPSRGPYTLRLETDSGLQTTAFATQTVPAPHGFGSSEEQFVFTLPDSGEIRGLEIWRDGSRLYHQQAGLRSQTTVDPQARLHQSSNQVHLTWLPSVFPYASVAHIGQERTTLALSLTGGEATLSTTGLPSGGLIEVVLSDGLNSQRFEWER